MKVPPTSAPTTLYSLLIGLSLGCAIALSLRKNEKVPAAPPAPAFRLEVGPTYSGLCDASGAAFLGADTFVAASDETQSKNGENRLQIYRIGTPAPIAHTDLNRFLNLDPNDENEADIESAARVGDRVYWISSHGGDSEGKAHVNRQRFFATKIVRNTVQPIGFACSDLLMPLTEGNPELKSARKAKLAPKEGGVSIEGLCEGTAKTLWVGFRSPLAYSRALCAEISNPEGIIHGDKPKIGPFWTLSLGGRGIRDWTKWGQRWLILAGSAQDTNDFALYEWNGNQQSDPRLLGDCTRALSAIGLGGMHPESLAIAPDGTLWIMADDGSLIFPEGKNKKLLEAKRTFRTVRVVLGSPIP